MIAHFTAQDLKIYQVRQGRKLLNKLVWTYQTLQTKDRKNKTVIQTQSSCDFQWHLPGNN